MLDNKLLKQSNIKGTFQLDFYPVTQWSAIVDAPSFEDNDGKVLNVTNNQLSWTGIKTINGESLFGDGNIIVSTANADWNENDSDSDAYVYNRTHYVETTEVECVVDEKYVMDLSPYVVAALLHCTPEIPISGEFSEYIVNGNAIELGDYRQYIIDGMIINYYGNLKIYNDAVGLGLPDIPDTGEDFVVMTVVGESVFIGVAQEYGDITSISFTTLSENIHKLDNKFLNDIPVSKIEGLATVATTNDYYSLDNLPSIPPAPSFGTLKTDVNSGLIPSQSESFSSNIQLHKISKTGNYNDLLSKPTKLSEFTNDVGFITSSEVEVYHGYEAGMVNDSTVRINLLIDDISQLTFQPCLFDIYFTHYGIPANGKLRFFDTQGRSYPLGLDPVDASVYYRTGLITSGIVNAGDEVIITNNGGLYVITNDAWNSTFSGDYNDLSNKPTIPVVPTNVSAFNNDAGYLTSSTETGTTAYWNSRVGYVPAEGAIIVYTDYHSEVVDGQTVYYPGIKIGSGNAYVQDLVFLNEDESNRLIQHLQDDVRHVTSSERTFWNNKLNLETIVTNETLVFTRN